MITLTVQLGYVAQKTITQEVDKILQHLAARLLHLLVVFCGAHLVRLVLQAAVAFE